jgi:hypothetical protein
MDGELLMEGVEHIKAGKLRITSLLELAMELEKHLARVGAIAQCVVDGTLYTPQGDDKKVQVKELIDYAELHYFLRTLKDTAKEMQQNAERALGGTDERAGNDGHTQRFAERMREAGLNSVKIDDVGTFYIKTKDVALPPSKKEEERAIVEFAMLCKSAGLDLDLNTTTLKMAEQIAQERGVKMPKYTTFMLYMRDLGLTHEGYNWQSLQKHVEDLTEGGQTPPNFIRVMKREEVMMRKA